ncbi:MAG: HNH nuclease family protein [Gammaproteobacteria bacterium]|nr:HNH nuclease family protein [Gammaproteobacteria bacterium]
MVGRRLIKKKKTSSKKLDEIVQKARNSITERDKGYREQSLKIHPWVCGRCGKEFNRDNLHLLTVHHVDHNHDNNPIDGSNWENLCIYCHDREHQKIRDFEQYGELTSSAHQDEMPINNPFDILKKMD